MRHAVITRRSDERSRRSNCKRRDPLAALVMTREAHPNTRCTASSTRLGWNGLTTKSFAPA
jgi:hypothetical protein